MAWMKEKLRKWSSLPGSRFELKDIVQQMVGATIFVSPFIITEELWNLAMSINGVRIGFLMILTVLESVLIVYFTEYRKLRKELEEISFSHIPMRMISLLLISYGVTVVLLWSFGILGIKVNGLLWQVKLVILGSFFASIGASTADIIK